MPRLAGALLAGGAEPEGVGHFLSVDVLPAGNLPHRMIIYGW